MKKIFTIIAITISVLGNAQIEEAIEKITFNKEYLVDFKGKELAVTKDTTIVKLSKTPEITSLEFQLSLIEESINKPLDFKQYMENGELKIPLPKFRQPYYSEKKIYKAKYDFSKYRDSLKTQVISKLNKYLEDRKNNSSLIVSAENDLSQIGFTFSSTTTQRSRSSTSYTAGFKSYKVVVESSKFSSDKPSKKEVQGLITQLTEYQIEYPVNLIEPTATEIEYTNIKSKLEKEIAENTRNVIVQVIDKSFNIETLYGKTFVYAYLDPYKIYDKSNGKSLKLTESAIVLDRHMNKHRVTVDIEKAKSLGYNVQGNRIVSKSGRVYSLEMNSLNYLIENPDYFSKIDLAVKNYFDKKKTANGYNTQFEKYIRLYRINILKGMNKADINAWHTLTLKARKLQFEIGKLKEELYQTYGLVYPGSTSEHDKIDTTYADVFLSNVLYSLNALSIRE